MSASTSLAQVETRHPDIELYHLQLKLELGDGRDRLPGYLGSTIRGIIAASFRNIVCVTKVPVCEGCLLLHRCSYPYIFETPSPSYFPQDLQKRFQQAPRPYVFDVPIAYRGEPIMDLGLILVGRAIDYLPYFLYVIQETGKWGMGRARVPYRLVSVMDCGHSERPLVFRDEEGVLRDGIQAITISDVTDVRDADVNELTLEFITPLRVKKFGRYQTDAERLDFVTLIDLLLGRLEALSLFHCGAAWTPDDKLKDIARSIEVKSKHMALQPLQRYSNRRQQKLPLDGLVGTMVFMGELGRYVPLLRLGAYVHIGAGTAFGLGQYRLRIASV